MALQILNEAGPISVTADGEAITAGQFVYTTSGNDVVTSTGGFDTTDLKVKKADAATDFDKVIGIALEDAADGDTLSVLIPKPLVIVKAGEAIPAGSKLQKAKDTDPETVAVLDTAVIADVQHCIGQAITGASASGKYLVAALG